MRRLVVTIAVLVVIACSGDAPKQSGEACSASSECDVGLVCDLGVDPHVCAGMGTPPPPPGVDAPPAGDGPAIDATPDAGVDAAIDAAIDAI